MTPPSTQNFKALGLRVFFLICCSTFSFLSNVGLRLTLEYLTISPSSETHDPSLVPPFTHLYGTRLPEISIRKTFDTGLNYTHPSRKPTALIPLCGRIRGGKPGRSHKNEKWANPYKGMTPPSTQNLKALGLRVFFLICCSTLSFLPNVELRLTLEYLTISPTSESHSSTTLIQSSSSGSILKPWPLTCTAVHTLIWDTLAWNLLQEDFWYKVKLYSSKP